MFPGSGLLFFPMQANCNGGSSLGPETIPTADTDRLGELRNRDALFASHLHAADVG
jgi:hypothetical protein